MAQRSVGALDFARVLRRARPVFLRLDQEFEVCVVDLSAVEAQLRVAATVAGSVGLIGLLLAAMGIYGVTAYTVARRTREIGIRLSLGAGRSAVVAMILRQGMTLVGIGLTIGLALSLGVGRMLAAQRFGITAPGAATFVAATMLFVVVALIACYAPLRRAIRIAAMDALRYE